jgi:hypothetical protein
MFGASSPISNPILAEVGIVLFCLTAVKLNIATTASSNAKGARFFFIIVEFISNIEQYSAHKPKFLPKKFIHV